MPADESLLGQNLVDERNEGRRSRMLDGDITIEGFDYTDQQADLTVAFCTCDEGCQADADSHFPDCPVEERLSEEFGGL